MARRREEDGRRLQSGAGSVIVPEAALSGTTPIRPPNATADCRNASAARYSMWKGSKWITWRTKECCIFTLHHRRVSRPTQLLIVFNQSWTCGYSGMIKNMWFVLWFILTCLHTLYSARGRFILVTVVTELWVLVRIMRLENWLFLIHDLKHCQHCCD